jgi:hypothetical protein
VMNANKARLLVYDLISENRVALRDTLYYNKLKSTRVRATAVLQRLGLPCTESVVLIPNPDDRKLLESVDEVYRMYGELQREISQVLRIELPDPIIRILDVAADQLNAFRELAERYVRSLLDRNIDRVSSIAENFGVKNPRLLIKSLKRLKRDWQRIRDYCQSMGLDVLSDIDYLLELIDDTVESIGNFARSYARGDQS